MKSTLSGFVKGLGDAVASSAEAAATAVEALLERSQCKLSRKDISKVQFGRRAELDGWYVGGVAVREAKSSRSYLLKDCAKRVAGENIA